MCSGPAICGQNVRVSEPGSHQTSAAFAHRLRRMSGRDPHEPHRVATPLELLFDLTFVIAFGVAASEFAHTLVAGHIGAGLAGFTFATFAVSWAWINFSWFASAYDTDDWVYRLTTMLQMVGVLVLALGIPPVFSSIAGGQHVNNRALVAGYVVMRIAMVIQWLRAARQDPDRRAACLTYAAAITVAQVGWVAVAIANSSVGVTFILIAVMTAIELTGPLLAEKRMGGTPWHAHHIVERNGLLTIIALGEGVVGTVASLSAVVADQGWTTDAVLVAVAGTGLTFGMWWVYFVVPGGRPAARPSRALVRLRLPTHSVVRVDRRHRCRPTCCRELHRTPVAIGFGCHRDGGRGARRRLRLRGLRQLPAAGANLGRVLCGRRGDVPAGVGRGHRAGGRRHLDGGVSARGHGGAGGRRGQFRVIRAPAPGGGDGQESGRTGRSRLMQM